MKQVIVHPERCVGCMQCMLACAVAHSRSQQLLARRCRRAPSQSRASMWGPVPLTRAFQTDAGTATRRRANRRV